MKVDQVPNVHHVEPATDAHVEPGIDPDDVLLQPGVLRRIGPARGDGEARVAPRRRTEARGCQAPRTSAIVTGRCSCRDSVQASAIQPASRASSTVHGEGRVPATTSVNAVSSAR
ncbi:hypothetical protein SAMN05216533_1098 [Streptomyces sp. Ag109_O5-10]|nr:hypothetical protein SAMN05216533_1098 [Streptomyces sp. Ag109_O5-10]